MKNLKHHKDCQEQDFHIIEEVERAVARTPKDLSGVNFVPWIGDTYGIKGPFGTKRLLVLGESHYEWCKACWKAGIERGHDLTCRVIVERILRNDKESIQHWRNIEYALQRDPLDGLRRAAFWHGIAYYNFIQKTVGFFEGGGRPPKPAQEMWDNGERAFKEVIRWLQPDIIVVLGFGLWEKLPDEGVEGKLKPLTAAGKTLERCSYFDVGGNRTVIACRVRHPAAGLG